MKTLKSTTFRRRPQPAHRNFRRIRSGDAVPTVPRSAVRVGYGMAAAGAALTVYRLTVRPWHRHWGATRDERVRALPGDDLVPDAKYRTTRAITIDAPIEEVWPWLVQIGQDRGGFYSYDRLERLVGAQIVNADEIGADWQHLAVGDVVRLAPEGRFGDKAKLTVSVLEPDHAIVFGPTPPLKEGDGSWAFVVEPTAEGRTRLLTRTQGKKANVPPFFFLFDLIHFVMERRMMLGIKARVERKRSESEAPPWVELA